LHELEALLPDSPEAHAVVERLRDELDPDRLLTTREAADLLGVRSVNTLKALLRVEQVPTVKVGTHTRIARQDVDRLRQSRRTTAMQESDRHRDEVDTAFGSEGLTQEEVEALSESRPGPMAWHDS